MKFGKITGVLLAGVMLLGGCSAGNNENSEVVMTIGDMQITAGEIKFIAQYGLGTSDASTAADFIESSLLTNAVVKQSGKTLSDEEANEVKTSLYSFKAQIGGAKKANEYMKEYCADDSLIEELMATSFYSKELEDLISETEPTDDEMKEYFKNNYMRAKHVLISTVDQTTGEDLSEDQVAEAEVKANEVLAKAQSGEDFDTLISEYNEDPGMTSNPDGYFFPEGQMVKEFEDTTKSLQIGEIGMCKTDYGFHIIKRLDINESQELFDTYFEKNKNSIEQEMISKSEEDAVRNKAEELGITVEINEDAIENIEVPEDTEDTSSAE